MSEQRTTESILNKLKDVVQNRKPTTPEDFIDAALYLEILKLDEQDLLLSLEMKANLKKLEIRKRTVSNADAILEWKTTEEYEVWQRQDRKLKEVQEFVRLAKKQADIRKI